MNDHARALLFVAALFGGGGYTGGRISVPDPPAEVRLIRMPPRVIRIPMAEAAPADPAAVASKAPVPPTSIMPGNGSNITELPVSAPASVEVTPLPLPRPAQPKPQPKASPKPEKAAAAKKPRSSAPPKKSLPSCAVVQREYDAMTWPERMSAYRRATAEEIAHGKRCLGL